MRAPIPLLRITGLCTLAFAVMGQGTAQASEKQLDLAAMPIEQLLTLEVYSASKFVQKRSEAPATVSVVTAADIKAFGWRNLADILRSMRGLYVTDDRNYSYLGARGFLRPGDYNTRFLLLVDGNRSNDSVYDQAAIGSEFILDVDLIDRVEFVSGPGSSIYGANAFFGVINIITKHGRDMLGPQVAVDVGSHGARKARASFGSRDKQGAEFLISASGFRDDGKDLYFPEFDTPANNNGVARRLDHDRGESVFMKGAMGPFSLSVAHSERRKGIPTAAFSQVFNDPRSHTVDTQSSVDFGYRAELGSQTELSSRLYWGRYDYDGDYVPQDDPAMVNRDGARARWWGGEAKLVTSRYAGHKLVLGAEYRRDYQRDQFNFNVDPYQVLLQDDRGGYRSGVYAEDEIVLRENLLFNAGLRYDHNGSPSEGAVNPRLALIYRASEATTFKGIYGTAFRAPNAYELYYQVLSEGGQKANPDLESERIRSVELSAEHYLSADARVTASVFRNKVSNLISQAWDPVEELLVFQNTDKATAHGVELEFEKTWKGGARLRTSFSHQHAKDGVTGEQLVNSPRRLAKVNLSTPLLRMAWRVGAEAQYVGPRKTLQGETGGYWLANLTIASLRLAPGLEASASAYNLFDRRYADPGGAEHVPLDAIRQPGREFRLKLVYTY
ncbi:MAG TPA: TonB-dependent receptor [Noviherbaspirillum sp.]|nr:TonB-dependent receptor [Noviherbaspirillum sp.]